MPFEIVQRELTYLDDGSIEYKGEPYEWQNEIPQCILPPSAAKFYKPQTCKQADYSNHKSDRPKNFYSCAGIPELYKGWMVLYIKPRNYFYHGARHLGSLAEGGVAKFPMAENMPWLYFASLQKARIYAKVSDNFKKMKLPLTNANTICVYRVKKRMRLLCMNITWNTFRILSDVNTPYTSELTLEPEQRKTFATYFGVPLKSILPKPVESFGRSYMALGDKHASRHGCYTTDGVTNTFLLPWLKKNYEIDGLIGANLNANADDGTKVNVKPIPAEICVYNPSELLTRKYDNLYDISHTYHRKK